MKKYGCTAIKYLFSVILIVISSVATKDPRYVLPSLVELVVIFLLSNMLIGVKKYFQVLNDILLLLFNVETAILYFGNSYLSYIMLENTDSISALRGHAVEYIVAIILVLIFSFLPTFKVEIPRLKYKIILPAAIILEIILTFTIGAGYSPAGGMYDLARQWRNQREMQKMIEVYASESNIEAEVEIDTQIESETEIKTEEKSDIETTTQTEIEIKTETETQQETSKSESETETQSETNIDIETATKTDTETEEQTTLSGNSGDSASVAISEPVVQVSTRATRKQNVILIFTEGLSNHIITDSRNIMPNVAALKNQTISFSNYYNHTFATYRGIQGTLYSGHQFDNYDKNNLTSVMDIMRENGYYTAMINTEPNNSEFTSYLNNMGFDAIVTDKAAEYDILDKQAYEMLYDTATAYENNSNPFFLVIYTFGTHASFDAPLDGVVYGDGTSGEINKFYNADYYFGMFFDKFKNSSLKDDTILVFTTDHATYMDDSYKSAFPEYARVATSCDEIPLYIYDNGVTMNVDAQGRNSLDMIPTLLDWMGLNSSTDFLGQSLFTQKQDGITMDTYFWNTGNIFYTGDDTIRAVDENISNLVRERVIKYCAEARK